MRFRTLLAASLLAVSLVPLAAFTVLQWREAQNEIPTFWLIEKIFLCYR